MEKIGIVTICDDNNYGNRLQNYAVQETIRKMGFEPVTLRNVNFKEYHYTYDLFFIKKRLACIFNIFRKEKKHMESIRNWNAIFEKEERRYANFQKFNEKIVFSENWITEYKMDICPEEYYGFVTGSDQVFNYCYGRANRIDFLRFAGMKRRIALSASVGVAEIPKKYYRRYKKYLERFTAVSVREETARAELERILKGKCTVDQIIDPTMMITVKEWEMLAQEGNVNLPENYIVVMYLGKCEEAVEEAITRYAGKHNCEIIRLNDKNDKVYYECGPYEFLKLIRQARMVFTDSFHTCVFSILFHKNFYASSRKGDDEKIFSRIRCLLDKFGFSDRVFTGGECEAIDEMLFAEADSVLQVERERFKSFLQRSLQEE